MISLGLSKREQEILEQLSLDPSLNVAKLSEMFSVSQVTIRTNLNDLEEKGLIVRNRGGGIPAFHPNIIKSLRTNIKHKEHIAQKAASMIKEGDNVMISAGTTTALIPQYLLGKMNIHIVTNSILILKYARANPSLKVTLVGGEFNPSTEAIVGVMAVRSLDIFCVNKSFVGCDAFSAEQGAFAYQPAEAEVVRKMQEQSKESILVADSSKYGGTGFAFTNSIDKFSTIITDNNLSPEQKIALEESAGKVYIV
ncbi:MAG: DeoR/GlpR transcriptional regulator [Planctomycetes bacterium]|nr:DeoR/GlpR transcriptional regulator [Planctomycetota bacterium]